MPVARHACIMLLLCVLLTSCSVAGMESQPTLDMAETPTLPTETRAAQKSQISTPTELSEVPTTTIVPTKTATDSPTPTISPTQGETSYPTVVVKGLRIAYVVDGDLYVQDSGEQPIQLTNSGQDSSPMFSDDGIKLIFRRGESQTQVLDVYSINTNGTGEQLVISAQELVSFGPTYDEFSEASHLEFIPGTHRLLFNTRQSFGKTPHYGVPLKQNKDMFGLDTDDGEIKQIFPNAQIESFGIAPNGKKVWVLGTSGFIDVISPDGEIIQDNVVSPANLLDDYSPVDLLLGSSAWVQWTIDSKGLIVVPFTDPTYDVTVGFRIWRYLLDGSQQSTIFHLPGMVSPFEVSPNGNWVLYNQFYPENENESGIYLGNLRTGDTKLLGKANIYGFSNSFNWNAKGNLFIPSDPTKGHFLASIDGNFTEFSCGEFYGWLDVDRFLCLVKGRMVVGEVGRDMKFAFIEFPGKKGIGWSVFVFPKPEDKE